MTVTVVEVNEFSVGMLIALFERAVGLYASLISVNAYHQPGVEAGKKAAAAVLDLQGRVEAFLKAARGPQTAEAIASGIGEPGAAEAVFIIARHLAANGRLEVEHASSPFGDRYSAA